MSRTFGIATDGLSSELSYNGVKFELIVEKKPFMVGGQPVKATLTRNGKTVCSVPCMAQDDDFNNDQHIKTYLMAYNMMRCKVIGYNDSLCFNVVHELCNALRGFHHGHFEIGTYTENEDTGLSERNFIDFPWRSGNDYEVTEFDNQQYRVWLSVSPPSGQLICVKLKMLELGVYSIKPDIIEDQREVRFFFPDTKLIPSLDEMLKLYKASRLKRPVQEPA